MKPTELSTQERRAIKAARQMSERWLATINNASHPIARLWRQFVKKRLKHASNRNPKINALASGWKSYKKRASREGDAKIAKAMASW